MGHLRTTQAPMVLLVFGCVLLLLGSYLEAFAHQLMDYYLTAIPAATACPPIYKQQPNRVSLTQNCITTSFSAVEYERHDSITAGLAGAASLTAGTAGALLGTLMLGHHRNKK
jgi:hypothetical protein